MKCHRCDNLMIYQDFYSADDHFRGWRCIGCGEIIDEVILENRQCQGKEWSRRKEGGTED